MAEKFAYFMALHEVNCTRETLERMRESGRAPQLKGELVVGYGRSRGALRPFAKVKLNKGGGMQGKMSGMRAVLLEAMASRGSPPDCCS